MRPALRGAARYRFQLSEAPGWSAKPSLRYSGSPSELAFRSTRPMLESRNQPRSQHPAKPYELCYVGVDGDAYQRHATILGCVHPAAMPIGLECGGGEN
jgi:hypothetical protein